MKYLAPLVLLGLAACASHEAGRASFPEAQRIVDNIASRHSDLVRLTIHAVPQHTSKSRVVASNVAAKLDDWSDPEDLRAMETKQPVTLNEGQFLDYTAPVVDASGHAIAAVGVTVKGANEAAKLATAKSIAGELSSAILASGKPLW